MENESRRLRMETVESPRLQMPGANSLPEQHDHFFQDRRYDSGGSGMKSRTVLNHRVRRIRIRDFGGMLEECRRTAGSPPHGSVQFCFRLGRPDLETHSAAQGSLGFPGQGRRTALRERVDRRDVVELESAVVDVAQVHSRISMGTADRDLQPAVRPEAVDPPQ